MCLNFNNLVTLYSYNYFIEQCFHGIRFKVIIGKKVQLLVRAVEFETAGDPSEGLAGGFAL